ncbi:MAG: MmgE/PrpD family protein [Betaproteobacteria bacterium]|nr:MAG: MmgE/PrpD family protein [Betaproteobacteria bacterium]
MYTRDIAGFVTGLRYGAIPAEVRERIKLLILDALGCALYGAHLEWCRILRDTLGRIDKDASCSVWGTSLRLSAPHAALANGTQIQGFELDDVHRAGVLHVGAVVLPALLAIAELRRNLGGEELRLDAGKAVHALGIAGTQASGLMAAQYGAMVKRMHAGRASQSGLYGALLAEQGFTGIEDVLESEYGGFCTTFSRSNDRFRLAELTAGLGETWQTMGVALKFYACVASNHTTLDALRDLQARKAFGAEDVQKIVVHGSQVTADHVGWKYEPNGLTAAQLNLPFCVATYLLEGDCGVEQFTDAAVADPKRMALAEKIEVRPDPAITAKGAPYRHAVRVEVQLSGGARLECAKQAPRGSERNFAAPADIIAKFEKLAAHGLPPARAAELRDAVLGLEKLRDAGRIADLMARG